jgi:CRISPR-associated endoribonuclease Cas6
MKFLLSLERTTKKRVIPINYQYELSAWIYRILQNADAQYSLFLHERGYQTQHKSFKLFSFSNLHIYPFGRFNDRIEILGNEVSFKISFYNDVASEHFIIGLFKNQQFSLGDVVSQVPFAVKHIETIALPTFGERVILKPFSPVVIGQKNDKGNDCYLPPDHPEFGKLLIENLMDKYKSAGQTVPLSWQNAPTEFKLLDHRKLRSRLITIKTGTPQETKVRGFTDFTFELIAPKELIEMALLTGAGRLNAMGFGYCEVV